MNLQSQRKDYSRLKMFPQNISPNSLNLYILQWEKNVPLQFRLGQNVKMRGLSRIFLVVLKCNHKYPYMRRQRFDIYTEKKAMLSHR